jgi:hypothetical protein
MNDSSGTKLHIKVGNMPPREERTTDSKLEGILKRISGREGVPCERNLTTKHTKYPKKRNILAF